MSALRVALRLRMARRSAARCSAGPASTARETVTALTTIMRQIASRAPLESTSPCHSA